MELQWNGQLIATLAVVWASSIAYVVVKAWGPRSVFYKLRSQGMPMPPWNPITGHLLCMLPVLGRFPKDVINTYLIGELFEAVPRSENSPDIMYLDMWPFGMPLSVVKSPDFAIQVAQQHDLPKPAVLKPFFNPFAGGDNLFTMNGPEWKRSRAMVAPGFNAHYLLGQMGHIVEETAVFVEILKEHAQKGDMFSLDKLACNFTMDIIGAVCFNSRMNSQRTYNPLAFAMRSQIEWHCTDEELNLFKRWNPIRPIVQWYNSYTMDKYITKELGKRFTERQGGKVNTSSRSMIDLVLENYITENPTANSKGLDPSFIKWACVQLRLMIFAGHDSTASTLCYCYYLLSKNPDAMAKLRAEHNEVFGTDLSKVTSLLLEQPERINRLSYTNAVMKEALRLFAPAAGMRGGLPGLELQDANGRSYPIGETNIWILHPKIQTHPNYWERVDEFLPERWLVGPEDPLYPVKGAYRPFEFGPRNCVGQTLVTQDIKTVLVMTLREFDILPAYDEWDKSNPTKDLKTVFGERAYQISSGAAHPADGFPCKVSLIR